MNLRIDRGAPPTPGAPRPRALPSLERRRLASGLELLLAPRSSAPLVELALLLPAGAERDPVGRAGLAALAAALADEGSDRRTGTELAALLERLGGSLASRADWDRGTVQASLLAKDLRRGLELVAEVALRPAFPEHEVERLRRQALAEIQRRRDDPSALADECLMRHLYAGTPYAAPLVGSPETLADLTRREIVDFHAGHYSVAASTLVVAGDFSVDAVLELAAEVFSGAARVAVPAPPEISPDRLASPRVVVVDRLGAPQSELRLGLAGIPRDHPDRTALGLINMVLGGKFTSRLNLNLRERHGITYGAASRLVDRRGPGPFVLASAVSTEAAGLAVRESLTELARLVSEPIDGEELAEARSYLLGVFPYSLQTIEGLFARALDVARFGLPVDHFARALDELEALDPATLSRVASDHLRATQCWIVVVGPAEQLEPQLAEFGELTRWCPPASRDDAARSS